MIFAAISNLVEKSGVSIYWVEELWNKAHKFLCGAIAFVFLGLILKGTLPLLQTIVLFLAAVGLVSWFFLRERFCFWSDGKISKLYWQSNTTAMMWWHLERAFTFQAKGGIDRVVKLELSGSGEFFPNQEGLDPSWDCQFTVLVFVKPQKKIVDLRKISDLFLWDRLYFGNNLSLLPSDADSHYVGYPNELDEDGDELLIRHDFYYRGRAHSKLGLLLGLDGDWLKHSPSSIYVNSGGAYPVRFRLKKRDLLFWSKSWPQTFLSSNRVKLGALADDGNSTEATDSVDREIVAENTSSSSSSIDGQVFPWGFTLVFLALLVGASVIWLRGGSQVRNLVAPPPNVVASSTDPVYAPFEPRQFYVVPGDGATSVNVRSGPGPSYDVIREAARGEIVTGDGRAHGTDGLDWIRLTGGGFIRERLLREARLSLPEPEVSEAPQQRSSLEPLTSICIYPGQSAADFRVTADGQIWFRNLKLFNNIVVPQDVGYISVVSVAGTSRSLVVLSDADWGEIEAAIIDRETGTVAIPELLGNRHRIGAVDAANTLLIRIGCSTERSSPALWQVASDPNILVMMVSPIEDSADVGVLDARTGELAHGGPPASAILAEVRGLADPRVDRPSDLRWFAYGPEISAGTSILISEGNDRTIVLLNVSFAFTCSPKSDDEDFARCVKAGYPEYPATRMTKPVQLTLTMK